MEYITFSKRLSLFPACDISCLSSSVKLFSSLARPADNFRSGKQASNDTNEREKKRPKSLSAP